MKKKIAIIGSGIAGLTLANLLKQNNNFEFLIYEKENSLNLEEGYGIQLSVNSVSILNKIGFLQLNQNEKYNPSKLDFYSENSLKICDLDLTIFNSENEKYTTLKRSILIKFLKEKLPTNSLIFRKTISKVEEKNKKISINFTDETCEEVDYIVVSDGVFSNTKSIIEKKSFKPNYYGAHAIRTQVNAKDLSDFDSKNISLLMGSNFHIVLYPINKNQEINLVCIIRQKSEKIQDMKTILENIILKKNKNLVNLFKKDLKLWPIYTSNKTTKSIFNNVFYIGDAFYAFPPTMAQGASQAIESANEIFNLINDNCSNIQNLYFQNRLKRTSLIKKRSKLNYFSFHISNSILKILRNKILKVLIKNQEFIKSYLGKVYK